VIPQWFPEIGFGFPTVAEGQGAHYQPLRLLFALLFAPASAMMWEIGFCFALAGVSTYFFLREFRLVKWACLLGGITQMFCAASLIFVRNLALHRSICLLPLGMFLAERWLRTRTISAAMGFSLVVALQLLSGHPTFAMITLVGTTLYLVTRCLQRAWHTRKIVSETALELSWCVAGWVLAILLGFGLAAVQVLPTVNHAKQSIRQGGFTYEYAVRGLPARSAELLQAAFPYAYEQGDWRKSSTQGINVIPFSNMYIGVLPLFLAWIAIWYGRHWPYSAVPLAICFVFATALALGPRTPLFPALWSLPGMNSMRYPSRFLLLSSFFLSCLAAVGLHHLAALSRLRKAFRSLLPAISLVFVGIVTVGSGLWLKQIQFRRGVIVSICLWVAAVLLISLVVAVRQKRNLILFVIVSAVLVELLAFRHISDYAPTFPLAEAVDPSESARLVQQDKDTFRVMSLVSLEGGPNRNQHFRDLLMANLSSVWGIHSADAWGSLFPLRYYMLREELVWELAHSPESANKLTHFLGALNVKYALSPNPLELTGWEKVQSSETAHIWKNPHVQPRVFLVGSAVAEDSEVHPEWEERANLRLEPYREMVPDWWDLRHDAQIVDRVMAQNIDYRTSAILSAPEWPPLPNSQPEFRVDDLTGPNETDTMRFRVNTDKPALMVISNSYDPGWTATVNGAPSRIFRTNSIVQGLFVSAGVSDVLLRYRAPGWNTGAILSLVSTLTFVALFLWQRQRLT